jgi:hypothetical protein
MQERNDSARIIEVRVYTLKPGARDSFHELFVRESLPMLRRHGVDVVADGPSVDDAVSYFLVRSFATLDDRTRSEDRFYNSKEWQEGPRDAVLAAIETYGTVVVNVDSGTVDASSSCRRQPTGQEGRTGHDRCSWCRRGDRSGRDDATRPE